MARVVLENKFAVAFMTTPLGRTDRRQRLVDIVRFALDCTRLHLIALDCQRLLVDIVRQVECP